MERRVSEYEMGELCRQLREHEKEIEQLSSETQQLMAKFRSELEQSGQNPEKNSRITELLKQNEDRVRSLKEESEKIKRKTVEIQSRLNERKTIKNYGILGYAFVFILKLIEEHAIDYTPEEIKSFIIYLSIGAMILLVDWMVDGIDSYLFGRKLVVGFFLVVFVVYLLCFGLKALWERYMPAVHLPWFGRKQKNAEGPGWILNP